MRFLARLITVSNKNSFFSDLVDDETIPSLTINNPAIYQQLKDGKFDGQYFIYFIKASAHPNLLDEIKTFAHWNQALKIVFETEQGDTVTLHQDIKRVQIYWKNAEHFQNNFDKLPTNYKLYDLYVKTITDADLDTTRQWRFAKQIVIAYSIFPSLEARERARHMANLMLFYVSPVE